MNTQQKQLAEKDIDNMIIPEEDKQIVKERIKKYENNPESYLSWNEIERKMAAKK